MESLSDIDRVIFVKRYFFLQTTTEISNEKSAKNEKVIATQTIEIQENDEIVSGVVLNIIPENKIKEMENKNHKYKKFSN